MLLRLFYTLVLSGLSITCAVAQSDGAQDFAVSFGDEEFVSIATGQKKPVPEAPAIASVITADDIRSIGATTLNEALETVPGLHISVDSAGYNPIYVFRGIYSQFNPQVLVLINGIPITNAYVGDRNQVWGRMPVEAIDRIEVIRGPGSAVYGADAFAGVINILTKDGDMRTSNTGVRTGSYDTKNVWISESFDIGEWDSAMTVEYLETDGHDGVVERDLQTQFDMPPPDGFGTDASLAPGRVQLGGESVEIRLDFRRDHWGVRLGYQGRDEVGVGAGVAQALDNVGTGKSDRYNADVTYKSEDAFSDWKLSSQLSWFKTSQETDLVLFPPGATLPVGDDGNIGTPGGGVVTFTDGVIGEPYVYEQHVRANTDNFYTGFEDHVVRVGFGVNQVEVETEERKNYGPGVIDGTESEVDGELTDVTGTQYVFMRDNERDVVYAFVQDEWKFAKDFELTSGLRYDRYSDFGTTVNPRLALVWQTAYNTTAKVLYGRAFRAPSFVELFNINNPVVTGNPDLDPEKIDTFEIGIDYAPIANTMRLGMNVFVYEMREVIRFLPDPDRPTINTARNQGKQKGRGLEAELSWNPLDALEVQANYAWQDAEDELTQSDVSNAPGQQLYVRLDYRFLSQWHLNTQLNYVADRKRETSDFRAAVADYTTVDSTVRFNSQGTDLEVALLIKNMFDENAREPSRAPGALYNDLPLAGRSAFVELRYSW